MIFVTLGSQKFQFDRLLQYVDKLIEDKVITDEVFAQIGNSNYTPKNFPFSKFVNRHEFQHYMNLSNLVITHAGTGAIVTALKLDKKVIAMPRLSANKEHVDDHQMEIAKAFEELNFIFNVNSYEELVVALSKVSSENFDIFTSRNETYISFLSNFIENIGR